MERVIVAFESEKSLDRICEILEGGQVAACLKARSAGEVKRLVSKQHVSTVVCGYKFKDESAEQLFYDLPPASALLVVARPDQIELLSDDVFHIAAPVSRSDLCVAVGMVLQMSRRLERALRPKRNQEENAVVEKAKRVLMEQRGMTEEEAHRFIQKKSMDMGAKMVQTAILILENRY